MFQLQTVAFQSIAAYPIYTFTPLYEHLFGRLSRAETSQPSAGAKRRRLSKPSCERQTEHYYMGRLSVLRSAILRALNPASSLKAHCTEEDERILSSGLHRSPRANRQTQPHQADVPHFIFGDKRLRPPHSVSQHDLGQPSL